MIVLDRVTKRYGRQSVLDEVSLSLGAEGVTALIGPNGAGKSTLFGVVGRLITPDLGTVSVDGADLATVKPTHIATVLAVLRQDNHLAARLTVFDLVEFGRYPHTRNRRAGAEDLAHIERALDYLDLQPYRDRFLDELSGGQRQRAFIAMILAQDTRYILLDEPLNNLDLRHAIDIMKLLRRMADELGKRVIVVLHDINVAAAYADRIVGLKDGRVIADATPREVMRPELLEQLYDVPVSVREVDGVPVALHWAAS